jgi:hypothetical protein
LLDVGRRGPNNPEDGTSPTTELRDLEKQHRAQLLGIGAIALEMHQSGEIDADFLMGLAAEVAETEEELHELRGDQPGPEAG